MKAKGNFMKIFEAVVLKRIDSGQEEVNQKLCYGYYFAAFTSSWYGSVNTADVGLAGLQLFLSISYLSLAS